MGTNHLRPSISIISRPPIAYSRCLHPRTLLHVPLSLWHPLNILQDILQYCPKLCIQRLLPPPCILPAPSPLIALSPCVDLKYWPQRHPLCHLPLYADNVGCCRLSSYQFPYFLCRRYEPHPIRPLPCPFPRDFSHKPDACHFHRSIHCLQQDPRLPAK